MDVSMLWSRPTQWQHISTFTSEIVIMRIVVSRDVKKGELRVLHKTKSLGAEIFHATLLLNANLLHICMDCRSPLSTDELRVHLESSHMLISHPVNSAGDLLSVIRPITICCKACKSIVIGRAAWRNHGHEHHKELSRSQSIQWKVVTQGANIVSPALCPWCFTDKDKEMKDRLQQ